MISILRKTAEGLEQLPEVAEGCWINVVDPSPEEVEELGNLGIPPDFITYSLDIDELPRTEREDNGEIFILIRVPFFQGMAADIPFTTLPLGIILMDEYIVTISRKRNDIINEFTTGRIRGLSTRKRYRFILRILLSTAQRYLAQLREINKTVEMLEDKLQLSMRNRDMFELLKYQKSLVYFTTALKANELMLERLQRGRLFHQYPEDEDLLEDVITENQQAIEMTNISSNILVSMMDAFASIISNNLNVVMKFLASVTIVVSLPTMVTSYFGMNVDLPFQEHKFAFLMIFLLCLVISLVTIWIFAKRDWF